MEIKIPEIKIISTGKIIVDKSNPNTMSDKAFASLKRNIERYGFLIPVITNKELKIADGFHRWKAARELGLTEVPVIALDIDEIDRRMLRQILNKLRGEHDGSMDAVEYQFILEQGQGDLFEELSTIGIDEINACINEVNPVDVVEDEFVPDLEKPPTYLVNKGDVYTLGSHRLMCGDSTDKADVDKLMDGQKADMVFTDPPYLMGYTGGMQTSKKGRWTQSFNSVHGEIKNDKMSVEDGNLFLDKIHTIIKEKVIGSFYITFYRLGVEQLLTSMSRIGIKNRNIIVWNKGNHTLSNSDYWSKYEPIFYGWLEEHNFYGENEMDIWEIPRTQKNDLHPTMKPLDLCSRAINNSSLPNESVLDLFGGSGSTLIACEQLNRKCYMMELDPKYCSVIIERWEALTKNKAVKVADGE
jgi:DNA modification methylase